MKPRDIIVAFLRLTRATAPGSEERARLVAENEDRIHKKALALLEYERAVNRHKAGKGILWN